MSMSSQKDAAFFLRIILKELGKEFSRDLVIDPWELLDLIIKDIHLRKDAGRRVRNENKHLKKRLEDVAQLDWVNIHRRLHHEEQTYEE